MQLNQLEIFCMVARLQSFSKAAKLLYLSQPAVSNHIHALESYYGAKFFNRHSHGVSLTNAGKVVYDFAVKILDLHDNMEREIDNVLNNDNKKLVVGASSSVGNYALPCSIWTFKEKYPEIDISLEIANSSTIIQQLLDDKIHLGVVEGPIDHKDLVVTDVFNDELILIAPASSEWLECEEVSFEEIKKHPLIMREQGSGIRKIWEHLVNEAGIDLKDLRVITEMGSIDAIKSAVESGLGVAIVSKLSAMKEIQRGALCPIKIKGTSAMIKFQCIYRPGKFQPSIASRFLRFLSMPEERSFC